MIAAIIVGALTAWYLGFRFGIITAIATAAALLLANFVPGMTLTVYALVIAWTAALYFFGPKISKASGSKGVGNGMLGGITGTVGSAAAWAKKMFGSDKRS